MVSVRRSRSPAVSPKPKIFSLGASSKPTVHNASWRAMPLAASDRAFLPKRCTSILKGLTEISSAVSPCTKRQPFTPPVRGSRIPSPIASGRANKTSACARARTPGKISAATVSGSPQRIRNTPGAWGSTTSFIPAPASNTTLEGNESTSFSVSRCMFSA